MGSVTRPCQQFTCHNGQHLTMAFLRHLGPDDRLRPEAKHDLAFWARYHQGQEAFLVAGIIGDSTCGRKLDHDGIMGWQSERSDLATACLAYAREARRNGR